MDCAVLPIGFVRCARCKSWKGRGDFYTNGDRGIGRWCKQCRCEDEKRRRNDEASIAKARERYETDCAYRARELLRAVKKRCVRNNIEFDISDDWLESRLVAGRCEITGLRFDFSIEGRRRNIMTPSIDRIVAGGGYVESNCRVIVMGLNLAMNEFGLEAFFPIAEALVKSRYPIVGR